MDPTAIIVAIAGAGGVGAWAAFRKSGPEAESITVGTLRGVIDELRTEVTRLSAETQSLRAEVRHLRQENSELRRNIAELRREYP